MSSYDHSYKAPTTKANTSFDAWMAKVNALIVKKTGFNADDLPDYNYLDAFEDGHSAGSTASSAIRAAREF